MKSEKSYTIETVHGIKETIDLLRLGELKRKIAENEKSKK